MVLRLLEEEDLYGCGYDLEFSMGLLFMLLVGFHVHLYDWSLLMLPILLFIEPTSPDIAPRGLEHMTLRIYYLVNCL